MLPAGWQPVEGRKVVVGKVPRPRSLPHASPLTHQDRNDRVEMYYELYGTGPEKVLLIMGVLPSPCICRCRRWLTLTKASRRLARLGIARSPRSCLSFRTTSSSSPITEVREL